MTTRRDLLQLGAATAAIAAASGLGPLGRALAQQRLTQAELFGFEAVGNVTLLHVADLHGQLTPSYVREPSVNTGFGDAKGAPPHLTGAAFRNHFGITAGSA